MAKKKTTITITVEMESEDGEVLNYLENACWQLEHTIQDTPRYKGATFDMKVNKGKVHTEH